MATFFATLNGPIANVARFANSVEKDVRKFKARPLRKLLSDVLEEGRSELERMFTHLVRVHYPSAESEDAIPKILVALRDRHINRWNLTLNNARATAADSVPEFRNSVRAKLKDGSRRSILARLDRELGGEGDEPGTNASGGRPLYGVIRADRKRTRRVLIRLVPYLKLLQRNTPRNFERDFKLLVLKLQRGRQTKMLVFISPGRQANSCKTCIGLNGRVLTEDALRYAMSSLKPQLFHPNCKHRILTSGLHGLTLAEYDPNTHGEVITLPRLHQMVAAGVFDKQAARSPFVSV